MAEDIEYAKLELEKQRIGNEHRARLRELRIKEAELAAHTSTHSPGQRRWRISGGIVVALITLVGTAFAAYYQGQATVNVQRLKFESDLILKAIETGDHKSSSKNLLFLVNAGFLKDENGQINDLNFEPEESPVLPTANVVQTSNVDTAAIFSLNLGHYYGLMAKSVYSDSSEKLFNSLGLNVIKRFDEHPIRALFLSTESGSRVLVIATATELREFGSDTDLVSISGGKVHKGLWKDLDKVWPRIVKAVQTGFTSGPISVVGHGLGGGLSVLAAWRLASAGIPVTTVVTYGQPRVGDREFAQSYNAQLKARTLRFVLN